MMKADFLQTNLHKHFPKMEVSRVEDGGVFERFLKARAEIGDEVTVLARKKASDYPACTDKVYVAPDGNDGASGSIDAPFASIARAIAALDGKGGRIILRGGIYRKFASDGVTAACGTKDAPLFIEAYDGEHPVITGAVSLKGSDFRPVLESGESQAMIDRFNRFSGDGAKNIYVADLPALGIAEEAYAGGLRSGMPMLMVDGKPFVIARYPNAGEPLLPFGTGYDNLVKQCFASYPTAPLHASTQGLGDDWEWLITKENPFYSRMMAWDEPKEAWTYAALYQEWHRTYYPLTLCKKEDGTLTVKSDVPCAWGLMYHAHNTAYVYNVPEELDTDGEWFLDKESGKLYIYASVPIAAQAEIAYVCTPFTLLRAEKAENLVISGIEVWGTLGCGIELLDTDCVQIQDCRLHDTQGSALSLPSAKETAVIFSDFSHTGAAMFRVMGKADVYNLTPDRILVQNCRFHTPLTSHTGIAVPHVIGSCISHNRFDQCVIDGFGMIESYVEYNDFCGASQISRDSGPFYCYGLMTTRSTHIRYNYFHDINISCYGVYIDDLGSDNYVYSNVYVYPENRKREGRCVNIHGGHQNVVFGNILVNAACGARDDVNYYVRNVSYEDGTKMQDHYVCHRGAQSEDVVCDFGGGLASRWYNSTKPVADAYTQKWGIEGSAFRDRMPLAADWLDLLAQNCQERDQLEGGYKVSEAIWDWKEQTGTRYPWGDMPLAEFLDSGSFYTRELYLRSPSYNVFKANVFLGCETDVMTFTHWGILTDTVEGNASFDLEDARTKMALAGDILPLCKESTWKSVCADFVSIPAEKIGLTE